MSFTDVLALVLGTSTTIVITTKANPKGTTTAPTARGSTCMFEQMLQRAGGDGAGLPSISKRRASVKKRMAWIMAKTRQLAQLL
jgi:hypothetical protein